MEVLTSDLAEAVWILRDPGSANSCSKGLCRKTVRSSGTKSRIETKRG